MADKNDRDYRSEDVQATLTEKLEAPGPPLVCPEHGPVPWSEVGFESHSCIAIHDRRGCLLDLGASTFPGVATSPARERMSNEPNTPKALSSIPTEPFVEAVARPGGTPEEERAARLANAIIAHEWPNLRVRIARFAEEEARRLIDGSLGHITDTSTPDSSSGGA